MMTTSCHSLQFPGGGPGLTPDRDARFLLHGDLPGQAGSYGPSAGVLALRPTGGELEQVTGRVDVPVDDQAARRAGEHALGERQAWLSPSARRAGLGTGEPAVRGDQRPAFPFGLVCEHPPRLAETLVGHGTGE